MSYYTLTDFDNIIFNGLQYSLPSEIIHKLQDLQKELGVQPTNNIGRNSNSNSSSNTYVKKRQNHYTKEKEVFVATKTKVPEKTGIEKDLFTVRLSLNKISPKNYDTHSETIINIISSYNDKECLIQFANLLFEISSSNTFLSELNAKLYKQLISLDPLFEKQVSAFFQEYRDSFKINDSVYEIRNKQNDRRKAMTVFFIQLAKEDVVSHTQLFECVVYLMDNIEHKLDDADCVFEIDELTECLYLYLTMGTTLLKEHEEWDDFYDKICLMEKLKPKEKRGISSRALFKFKDILDFL